MPRYNSWAPISILPLRRKYVLNTSIELALDEDFISIRLNRSICLFGPLDSLVGSAPAFKAEGNGSIPGKSI